LRQNRLAKVRLEVHEDDDDYDDDDDPPAVLRRQPGLSQMQLQLEKNFMYFSHDCTGMFHSLQYVQRRCKDIEVPTVNVQPDKHLQQCAELQLSLTDRDWGLQ
jgi:hypothetical protein